MTARRAVGALVVLLVVAAVGLAGVAIASAAWIPAWRLFAGACLAGLAAVGAWGFMVAKWGNDDEPSA